MRIHADPDPDPDPQPWYLRQFNWIQIGSASFKWVQMSSVCLPLVSELVRTKEKLQNKGIKGRSLEWFKSYLTGRRQVVDVNGHKSSPEPIDMSVIQGSILGPILFLVYIDDLPSSSLLETFLFADDTQGLKACKNLPDLIDCVNSELKKWA